MHMNQIYTMFCLLTILTTKAIGQEINYEKLPCDSNGVEITRDFHKIPEIHSIIGDTCIQLVWSGHIILLNGLNSKDNKAVILHWLYEYPYSKKGPQDKTPINFVYEWSLLNDSLSQKLKTGIRKFGIDSIPSSEMIENWKKGNGCSPGNGFYISFYAKEIALKKGYPLLTAQESEINFFDELIGFYNYMNQFNELENFRLKFNRELPYKRTFGFKHGPYRTRLRNGRWKYKRQQKRRQKQRK